MEESIGRALEPGTVLAWRRNSVSKALIAIKDASLGKKRMNREHGATWHLPLEYLIRGFALTAEFKFWRNYSVKEGNEGGWD